MENIFVCGRIVAHFSHKKILQSNILNPDKHTYIHTHNAHIEIDWHTNIYCHLLTAAICIT